MAAEQHQTFHEKVAKHQLNQKQEYLARPYIGKLPLLINYVTLRLIRNEHLHMEKHIKKGNSTSLKPYNKEYSVTPQFGLPYRHTIFERVATKKALKLTHIHPH